MQVLTRANEVYIGNIAQKKYVKDFVGGKNHIKPREEWLVSCGHHEPVIKKEDFDRVQAGRGKKKISRHNQTHPLVGKLVCGGCKRNLRYRGGLNPYFTCGNRCLSAMKNCVGKVNVLFMEQYILRNIQAHPEKRGEPEKFRMGETERLAREIRQLEEKRELLLAKKEKLNLRNFKAYENYACGRTEKFQSCQDELEAAERELDGLDDNLQKLQTVYSGRTECGSRSAELSKEMIERLIDKIIVYDGQHMEIQWKKGDKAPAGALANV